MLIASFLAFVHCRWGKETANSFMLYIFGLGAVGEFLKFAWDQWMKYVYLPWMYPFFNAVGLGDGKGLGGTLLEAIKKGMAVLEGLDPTGLVGMIQNGINGVLETVGVTGGMIKKGLAILIIVFLYKQVARLGS